jgi:hypothetical protein
MASPTNTLSFVEHAVFAPGARRHHGALIPMKRIAHMLLSSLSLALLSLALAAGDGWIAAPSPNVALSVAYAGGALALSTTAEVPLWQTTLDSGAIFSVGGRVDASWQTGFGWLPALGGSALFSVTDGPLRFYLAPGWSLSRVSFGDVVSTEPSPSLAAGVAWRLFERVGLRLEGSVLPGVSAAGLSLGLEVQPWR